MKELHYTTSINPLPILQVVDKLDNRYIIQDNGEQITMEGVKAYKQLIVILENPITYENIIAAIVNARYSSDDVTAITLNHLLTMHNEAEEDKKDEYVSEYNALQEWRNKAKEIAKDVLGYAQKQNMI